MPTFRQDVKLGTNVPLIKTDDISDGAVALDKCSPAFQEMVAGWENARKQIETIPDTIMTDVNYSSTTQEGFKLIATVMKKTEDGYEEDTSETSIPLATSTLDGAMSSEDKWFIDDIRENGIAVNSIPLSEIEELKLDD